MSFEQDNAKCAKCGVPCGYDDGKAYLYPGYLCERCKNNLMWRFFAFFGIESGSNGSSGLEIEWKDIDKILSKIKRDYAMRVSIIETDEDYYEQTKKVMSPIEEPYSG